MKTVTELKNGETLLTQVRKVKGEKYQVELAQLIENPKSKVNVAALFNADDAKFESSLPKARRAWQTGTAVSLLALFGIDVASLTFNGEKQVASNFVPIENPMVGEHRLVIQLNDSVEADPKNPKAQPKQFTRGKDKIVQIMTKDGAPIYQKTSIVAEKDCKHTILEADATFMSAEQFADYAVAHPVVHEGAENLASVSGN